jgi:hypothetical protein
VTRELNVPFFRPDVCEPEIAEVVATLRSGWLTTGPRARRFEQEFAAARCPQAPGEWPQSAPCCSFRLRYIFSEVGMLLPSAPAGPRTLRATW